MSQLQRTHPKVAGRCPMGCGETLFLGEGGWVTCSYVGCPNPARVAELLRSFRNEPHLIFVASESQFHANAAGPARPLAHPIVSEPRTK